MMNLGHGSGGHNLHLNSVLKDRCLHRFFSFFFFFFNPRQLFLSYLGSIPLEVLY